jgi:hypothetical protein
MLDKVAEGLKKHDLDISSLVGIAEDLKDDAFLKVLENADFSVLDKNILEKFMPFLDDVSKKNLFAKIIDGEVDYHFLEIFLPHVDPYYVSEQIEAAVMTGTIEWDALEILEGACKKYRDKIEQEKRDAGWTAPK